MKFHHIACGGTFDHFHEGHKAFLDAGFLLGEHLTVGVTNDEMVAKKPYSQSIQSYSTRRNSVIAYARLKNKQVTIVKLNTIFGPLLSSDHFEAILVTKETEKNAQCINKRREELGIKPPTVVSTPYIFAQDGVRISSERIRQGVINREGKAYAGVFVGKQTLILPDTLKRQLRIPLGRVFPSVFNKKTTLCGGLVDNHSIRGCNNIVAIGDIVCYVLKHSGVTPTLSLIDGKTQRKALNDDILCHILEKDRCNALNRKGTIEKKTVEALMKLLNMGHNKAPRQMFIEGEEDLLTLPAILFAPLGYCVWYGMRDRGCVCVKVTEKKKEKVYNILSQFE